MSKLVAVRAGKLHRVAPLAQRYAVGRDVENDLSLDADGISRWHCVVAPLNGGYEVVDQGSTNGTLLNGAQVSRARLEHGDQIEVGDTVLLFLSDDADVDAAVAGIRPLPPLPSFERPPELDFQSWLLHLTMLCQAAGSQEEAYRVLARLLQEVLGFTGYERGLLLLNGGDPRAAVAVDRAGQQLEAPDFDVETVERASREGHAVETRREGVWALCLPLTGPDAQSAGGQRQRTIGHLYFDSSAATRLFDLNGTDRRLLESVAGQLALVLLNVVLLREATTDPLTGLSNRRATERVLRVELTRARELSEPLCVLMLDLDHFKRVNDVYGHQVGDEVLEQVAQRAREATRRYDCLGRWGGEEFLVVLPSTGEEGGRQVAEKIARSVSAKPLASPGIALTVSIGVAVYPAHGHTLETLVRSADQALYAAKAGGRNQIVLHTPRGEPPLDSEDKARTQRLPLPAFRNRFAGGALKPRGGASVGEPGPTWRARDLRSGRELGPAELRGRPTLLHFWTPWCSRRCERGHEFLERLISLRGRHGEDRLQMVGVLVGQSEDDRDFLRAFCEHYQLDWQMLLPQQEAAMLEAFGVDVLPALSLLDADGTLLANGPGWRTLDEAELLLAEVTLAG